MSSTLSLLPTYFIWHYTLGVRDLLRVWRELFYFFGRFFSIKLLFSTLFSPFERFHEGYKKGLDIESVASTFVFNSLMRVIGFLVRIFTITLGLIVEALWCVIGVSLFIFWIALPALLVVLVWFLYMVIIV